MLTVETIRKVRLAAQRGKSIRQIAKDFYLSRNTVRKVLRSEVTEFLYERQVQPRPKLGPYLKTLECLLEEEEKLPRRRRRSSQLLYEELQTQGYSGGYDSVRRYVKDWRWRRRQLSAPVFIPLVFGPGEAFQFDWSEDYAEVAGVTTKVNLAHVRLCHSRMFLVRAYPRQTQEMVLDAHIRAFSFFGGSCGTGIYDNMKTVVSTIYVGKQRDFHPRFEQLSSHYLFEPVACTPGAGWEKGQVENQVGLIQGRFFKPRPKVKDYPELNRRLEEQSMGWVQRQSHPKITGKTIWEVFQEEREHLIRVKRPFDGFVQEEARVSPYSLVPFDRNRYSVMCTEAGKVVEIRAYADRIVIVSQGEQVGEHGRRFGRQKTIYNPWHYLPILERKPGALRNGEPFQHWELPQALKETEATLKRYPDWDRQFVSILCAVPAYGLVEVTQACEEALREKTVSKDVILNLLNRHQDEGQPPSLQIPEHLRQIPEPIADLTRYDRLRKDVACDAG
jgi:transposase